MKTRSHLLMTAVALLVMSFTLMAVQAKEGELGQDPLQGKIDKSSLDLEGIRQEIQKQQNLITNLDDQEAQVQRDNQEIITEIDLIQKLLGGMDQRERLLLEQDKELSVSLQQRKIAYHQGQQTLARNLRSMYVNGRQRKVEMVLTAESFSRFVTRMKWEAMLTRLGAGLVEQTRQDGRRLQSRQKQLEVARAEINLSREEAVLQTSRLEELMAEQMESLRELASEKKGIKNKLLELSMNEQRLAYILEDLEQQRIESAARNLPAEGSLQELAGQLDWPVRGQVLRGFGRSVHPRFKTVTLNNGINIAANVGAPVAAVGGGGVEFADVLPGFGQCVILDHGTGYYTLYAHLDRVFVAKGEIIARGQVIAEVGRPAPREQSQLYFEVRHGKTPLDPADWLRSR